MLSEENQQNNEKKRKTKVPTDLELIEEAEKQFKWPFLHPLDMQATYLVGLYFNLIDYQQQNVLKTRSLQKKMRYLLNKLQKTSILKIIEVCFQIQMKIMEKIRSNYMPYSEIRRNMEEKIAESEWISTSEELNFAFMFGYDLFWKVYKKLNENG